MYLISMEQAVVANAKSFNEVILQGRCSHSLADAVRPVWFTVEEFRAICA